MAEKSMQKGFNAKEFLMKNMVVVILIALILAGLVAALLAWLIGLPVLRLKSDYLAIATLGFAEKNHFTSHLLILNS